MKKLFLIAFILIGITTFSQKLTVSGYTDGNMGISYSPFERIIPEFRGSFENYKFGNLHIKTVRNDVNLYYRIYNEYLVFYAGPGMTFYSDFYDGSWWSTEGWINVTVGTQIFLSSHTPWFGIILETNYISKSGLQSNFGVSLKLK